MRLRFLLGQLLGSAGVGITPSQGRYGLRSCQSSTHSPLNLSPKWQDDVHQATGFPR